MQIFLALCWEKGNKPNVVMGRKWLNHSLTQREQPPVNKMHRARYATVLDFLAGLSKQVEWRDWMTQGAVPLKPETIKKIIWDILVIFHASIKHKVLDGICLEKLRNKTVAVLMIVNPRDGFLHTKTRNVIQ